MAEHVHAGEDNHRQQNVHGWAGNGDQKTLPARMAHEFARIAGALFHGILASHFYVAAERQQADAIVGLAATEADQALTKAQAESLNPDFEQFGHGIMAKLMNKHQDSQYKDERNDRVREKMHR